MGVCVGGVALLNSEKETAGIRCSGWAEASSGDSWQSLSLCPSLDHARVSVLIPPCQSPTRGLGF